MGFWKNLFSSSDSSASSSSQVEYEGYEGGSEESVSLNSRSSSSNNGRIFFSTDRDIDLYELEELCNAVGWSRRPLRKVKKAIQYSFLVVSMWQIRGNQRRLIGFARATSDHAFNATLWDVVVHPDFQNKGMGKALMKFIIKKLRSDDISNITLFADPHVVDFYRNLGFISDPEGIKGMFWYPD
ncbi:putative N-acetyltransferase ycf52-like [Planktothrix agardhii]|uniref:GNAT family N-acetyltransferase n=2 Tax=Microcoleaceae TaxID=1892252 RepID=UPI00047CA93E|nr:MULTISPECIES: GNAT family N-acetyltransferase [Planktothrix]CAD5935381.1 putative N-acetyltransferase ycf52-like [Planktothrix agardhii]